jgi:hypothetical protein
MKKLILTLLAFSYAVFAGPLYASGEPNQPVYIWGQEVNGLQAAVEFIPQNDTYKQGEVIGLFFHVRNVSNRRIQFITSDWRNEDKCIIKDPDGNEISCNHILYNGWTNVNRLFLDPRESVSVSSSSFGIAQNKSFESREFSYPVGTYVFLKPGRYLFSYQLRFPAIRSTALPDEPNDWIGTLETGRREIVVLAELPEPNNSKAQ